jgi:hypothetical protein
MTSAARGRWTGTADGRGQAERRAISPTRLMPPTRRRARRRCSTTARARRARTAMSRCRAPGRPAATRRRPAFTSTGVVSMRDAGESPCWSAAAYTIGLNVEPGCRRASNARSNEECVKSRPPTSARTSPVLRPARRRCPAGTASRCPRRAAASRVRLRVRPAAEPPALDARICATSASRAPAARRVEAGVHAQPLHVRVRAEALAQFAPHGGHVVRRGAGRLERRRERSGSALRLRRLRRAHDVLAHQHVEHDVAPLDRAVRMLARVVALRGSSPARRAARPPQCQPRAGLPK